MQRRGALRRGDVGHTEAGAHETACHRRAHRSHPHGRCTPLRRRNWHDARAHVSRNSTFAAACVMALGPLGSSLDRHRHHRTRAPLAPRCLGCGRCRGAFFDRPGHVDHRTSSLRTGSIGTEASIPLSRLEARIARIAKRGFACSQLPRAPKRPRSTLQIPAVICRRRCARAVAAEQREVVECPHEAIGGRGRVAERADPIVGRRLLRWRPGCEEWNVLV